MINLIPSSAKRSLAKEYWLRVISVWFFVWSGVLFMGTIALLPAYVLISTQVEVYKQSAEEAIKKVAVFENVSVALVQASQEAKIIIDEKSLPRLSSYVKRIEGLRGEGVVVNEIRLVRAEEGVAPIVIQGVAQDRQTLASFRDRLQADPLVKDVELPISNLAQDRDVLFTLTITTVTDRSNI
jgi:hypothetical protein